MTDFTPVESSTISEVYYELDAKTEIGDLYLRFKGKYPCIYRYAKVPKALVLAFMDAESKGGFHAKFIKGHFVATKLPDDMMADGGAVDTGAQYDDHGMPLVELGGGQRAGKKTKNAIKRMVGVDMAKPGSERTVRTFHCPKCGSNWLQGEQHRCRAVGNPSRPMRLGNIDL